MSALADSSPRFAPRHRRWDSSGRGGAAQETLPDYDLSLSIRPDTARQLSRNAHPARSGIAKPRRLPQRPNRIQHRLALKSP